MPLHLLDPTLDSDAHVLPGIGNLESKENFHNSLIRNIFSGFQSIGSPILSW